MPGEHRERGREERRTRDAGARGERDAGPRGEPDARDSSGRGERDVGQGGELDARDSSEREPRATNDTRAFLHVRARVDGRGAPRLDVDLTLDDGLCAVMGASGAGKTTLLETIAGLTRPSEGHVAIGARVVFDARDRIFVPPHRREVGFVFQSLALFPHLSVRQNVAYGVRDRARRRELADTWLARTHAASLAERRPDTLSGGEAQRVALARAFAAEPKLLLLDEPFSALDRALRAELGDVVRALHEETRVPVVLVTHHREDAERLASRVVTLDAGRVIDAA